MSEWPEGAFIKQRTWHFHARLLERYSIILEPGEYGQLIKRLKAGDAVLVRASVYLVKLREIVIMVVWNGLALVTVLGGDMRPKRKLKPRRKVAPIKQWKWVGHDVRFGEFSSQRLSLIEL